MLRFALIAVLSFALAGCGTLQAIDTVDKADVAIKANFSKICEGGKFLDAGFQIAVLAGRVTDPAKIAKEARYYGELTALCEHPETVGVAKLLLTAYRLLGDLTAVTNPTKA